MLAKRSSWAVGASSALVNLVACALVLALLLLGQQGFGKGDTSAFLCWTIPLALAIAAGRRTWAALFGTSRPAVRVLTLLVVAAALAYGWLWLVHLVLGPLLYAFSFPVFYVWLAGSSAQLVFLSYYLPAPAPLAKRAGWLWHLLLIPAVGVGSVAVVLGISYVASYSAGPEKERYIIPADFQGDFRIIYGQPCGIDPMYEQGRRVLQIPADGLLLIKPAFKAGWIDNDYYVLDSLGHRQKLYEQPAFQENKPWLPCILPTGAGVFGGPMPDGSFSGESPLAIYYTDFKVFIENTGPETEEVIDRRRSRLDSLTTEKVARCRKLRLGTPSQ